MGEGCGCHEKSKVGELEGSNRSSVDAKRGDHFLQADPVKLYLSH